MSIDVPTCPLAISGTTLSAWRDDLLSDAEARQITEHIDSCPVCQRTIAQFDRIAGAIQRLTPPDVRDQSWRGIRAGLTPPRRWPLLSPAFRRGAMATACLLVLVALFAVVLRQRPSTAPSTSLATTIPATLAPYPSWTPTTAPTPAPPFLLTVIKASGPPVPGPQPNWQVYKLPYGIIPVIGEGTYTLSVAPSDGNTAYACDGRSYPAPAAVIVTHDRAAHWTRLPSVPTCSPVTIDDMNPNIVIIGDAISYNGGYSWQHPPALKSMGYMFQLISRGSDIYADFLLGNQTTMLAVSHDHLQTWTAINPGNDPATSSSPRIWLSPDGSDILVETTSNTGKGGFWHSLDAGQHWTQLVLPSQIALDAPDLFRFDAARHNWYICGSPTGQDNSSKSLVTFCSRDLGHTWTQLPDLILANSSNYFSLGFAPDGSFVASLYNMPPGVGRDYVTLMRLPVGATRWQNLGAIPDTGYGVVYYPGSGNGTLWDFPDNRQDESQVTTAPMP